jgi:PAS domain S-box-containing protein
MGTLMRAHNWSATPLGPLELWQEGLKTLAGVMLGSNQPMFIAWGPERTLLYNDAYAEILARKHPAALGRPFLDVWSEIRDDLLPIVEQAYAGEPVHMDHITLVMERQGHPEEAHFSFSYTPVRDGTGAVAGFFCPCTEITGQVLAERRLATETERQRRLFERAPGFITILSGPEHVFEFVNDAYAGLFGRRDFVGKTARAAFPELEGQGFFELLDQVYRTGQRFIAHHIPIRLQATPDTTTEERYLDFIYEPVIDDTGQVTGIFCEGHDVTEAHLAQEALRAGEQELLLLTDALPVLVSYMDAEVRYRFVNKIYEQWFPRPRSEIIGKRVRDVVGEEAYSNVKHWIDAALAGQRVTFEQFMPYKEGRARHIRVEYVPRTDESGRVEGFYSLVEDVTDQKATEAALRESEARLRELNADLERQVIERTQARGLTWQVSPDLMGALNSQGYFETSNPAWQTVLGWSEAEVASMSIFEMLHPDDVERTRGGFELTQQDQPAIRFPNRYRCKDGSYRWISWVGVPEDGMVYCTGRDITEEMAQAAELAQRTAERDQLWTLSEDMLARADYDGRMSAVSPAWTRVLGFTEAELLTRPYADFMHPDDVEATVAGLARMGETGMPTRFENRILTASGAWKSIEWTVAPEPDGVNFIAIGRDITAEKEAAAELEQAQEALRQAQKMEAVGQLTGGIAHDFNNLLAGIVGSLDLMQTRIAQGRTETVERYARAAMSSAQRAAALTHRLLAFSRRQPLDPKPVNANQLVASMEDLLRRTIGPLHALEIVTAGGLWTTLCDPNQLESAILNLAINARDAMPDGGRLTIETCNAHLDNAYVAAQRDVTPGQYVCICVTDSGTGMPPDVIARAFEPFFTTKPLGQGTGLGLSMVYGFAKQSEGHLRIYSEVGQGTTVKIYLPRHRGTAEEEESRECTAEVPRSEAGETVLVVDDEPVIRDLIVEVLQDLGYRALEAPDGPSGLKVLHSRERVDLLVTDVGLPGINGRQLADQARVTRPGLKVLFITGYAENATLANGFLDPGMEMITKPFAIEALATRIRSMIQGE